MHRIILRNYADRVTRSTYEARSAVQHRSEKQCIVRLERTSGLEHRSQILKSGQRLVPTYEAITNLQQLAWNGEFGSNGPGDISYLRWQLSLQVSAWLSQELRQGVLSVVGQTRLQDASWLAQLAKHTSEVASAKRNLLVAVALVPAAAVPNSEIRNAAPNANLIETLRS